MSIFYRVYPHPSNEETSYVFTKEAFNKLLITDQEYYEIKSENITPSEKIYGVNELNEIADLFDVDTEGLTEQNDDLLLDELDGQLTFDVDLDEDEDLAH